MTATREATPDFVELVLSPEFRTNPYPGWAALRAADPVHWCDLGCYVITRYRDVSTLLRHPRTSVNLSNWDNYVDGSVRLGMNPTSSEQPLLSLDPPDHTRLRGLVSQVFTARLVEGLAPRIQELVDGLLDELARAEGPVDVAGDRFAYPIPVTIICELLGVPAEEVEVWSEWSEALAHTADPAILRSPAQERAIADAIEQFAAYFKDLIRQRRSNLGDDLLSGLLRVSEDGERITRKELAALVLFLLTAGHETTVNFITNGIMALLAHPNELRRLRDDPTIEVRATEELLRYDGPVQFAIRVCLDDIELDDATLPAGSLVVAALGAASRDPESYTDPDRLDLGRAEKRVLAFGGGIHFCLGAPLARLQGRIAITSLVRRFPNLALAGDVAPRDTFNLRGLSRLPLALR